MFDRTCTQWQGERVSIPEDVAPDKLSICTGMPDLELRITGNSITTLQALENLTVSVHTYLMKTVSSSVLYYGISSLSMQSVSTLSLSRLSQVFNLRGLENLGRYSELVVENNPALTTLEHLSANLPSSHRIEVTSVGLRTNPLLTNIDGLRIISNVTGEMYYKGC